ncbi:unnamed protein product [Clavelina lepadiformis]|uniref:Rieske domain-containing protein n=1 Tax=Clavelina lepadiformis TaxID=159417 RepID=A0ABP0EUN5_CLALP
MESKVGDNDEFIESIVCKVQDFKSGHDEEMKEVTLGGDGKCLLVRHRNGEFTAMGHKCTHYGAPLIKGVLSNNRVRCPWHGACFNTQTGDIEDFPGLDSLHLFLVTVQDDDVIVRAKKRHLIKNKRNDLLEKSCMTSANVEPEDHNVVIIGGGPSSLTCAETLRKEGFTGRVILVSKERHPPYDRPKLSKALDVSPSSAYLRPGQDYYEKIGIELRNDVEVLEVDVVAKSVKMSKSIPGTASKQLKYDDLVIATGGEPRTLEPIPGWNLKNVFVLRTPDDANAIAEASKDKKVVIVGSSFIGMEVASFLGAKKIPASIAVVCGKKSAVPFQSSLGKLVGHVIQQIHEEKAGVKFHPLVGVAGLFSGDDGDTGYVREVELSDGTRIEAEVVVVGIGVIPATSFLRGSEIRMNERGFIPVDGRMQTKIPHVYAVGDITLFPFSWRDGELVNVQHWQMAHTHGRIAAMDIAESLRRTKRPYHAAISTNHSGRPIKSVPFFWTVQFGSSIRYTGYGAGFNDVIISGSLDERKFAAYYFKNDVVVAVATIMADPLAAQIAEKILSGVVITRNDIPVRLPEEN